MGGCMLHVAVPFSSRVGGPNGTYNGDSIKESFVSYCASVHPLLASSATIDKAWEPFFALLQTGVVT